MASYLLSYDLRKTDKDYDKLYEVLEEIKATRILESVWQFRYYSKHSEKLKEYFRHYIDKTDGLVIVEISEIAAFNTDNSPKAIQ